MTARDSKSLPALRTEYAFTARAALAPTIVVGAGPEGLRRYVPIQGGAVHGPMLRGEILPAGGDSQVFRADDVLDVEARYVVRTVDGVNINVVNRGMRHGAAEVIARLSSGETVAPSEYYFRTVARFEAPLSSPYEWLNKALFICSAEREPDTAIVHFFKLL